MSRLLSRRAASEAVTTRVLLDASVETVWNRMMFYEEVPGRPPFLLGILLPWPVRSEGDKTRVGATIQCIYRGGALVKRIAAFEPPHFVQFEVLEQRLGIERWVSVLGGSYEIRGRGDGAEVALTTRYRPHLRPRRLWRPLETYLAGQLHRHILNGMRAALAESPTPANTPPGGLACTTSPSRCRQS